MNPKKLKQREMPSGECIELLYDSTLIGYIIRFGKPGAKCTVTKSHDQIGWSAWRIKDSNTDGIRLLRNGSKHEAISAITDSLSEWD